MQDQAVDIVVTSPTGHRSLVVEVKLSSAALERATDQLRQYMLAINADVGLVVTSSAIRILRQTFRVSSAVEIVGEFPLSLAPGIEQTSDPIAFEDQVQRWLEALRDRRQHVAEPLLSALDEHVVPSLIDGDIRAAHPRLRYAVG